MTVALAMALWAAGVIELPESARRLVDWVGGLTVLAILILWVRRNGAALAAQTGAPHHDDPLQMAPIRSRPVPLSKVDAVLTRR